MYVSIITKFCKILPLFRITCLLRWLRAGIRMVRMDLNSFTFEIRTNVFGLVMLSLG